MRVLTFEKIDHAILTLFTFLLLVGWNSRALAQDEFLTPAADEYRIFGSIRNEQGDIITGAKASLVTPPTDPFLVLELLYETPAVTSVECDDQGSFDIRVPAADKRWNATYERTDLLLIVQASGYETSITKFQRPRLLVQLPLEVTVKKCSPWNLTIEGQDHSVIPDFRVSPAVISGIKLPCKLDLFKAAKSKGNGVYEIEGLSEKSLGGVYLKSDSNGNYCIRSQKFGDKTVIRLPKTGVVHAGFKLPKNINPAELAGEKIIITGGNLYPRNETTLQPISWSILSLDQETKVVAKNVLLDSVTFGFLDPLSIDLCSSMKDSNTQTLSAENSPLEIRQTLYVAKKINYQFVDESGNPIPHINEGGFARPRGKFIGNGTIAVPVPVGEKPIGQIFPYDASGRYQINSQFGVIISRTELIDGQPKPIEMTRSRSLRGRVTDGQGKFVAGAKVEYTIKSERFTLTQSVLSSSSGTFEIGGLPPETNVVLSASKDSLTTPTDTNISAISGQPDVIEIPVIAQPIASLRGMVTDQSGNPIIDANVKLYAANVIKEEGYGGESSLPIDLIPDFAGVFSDKNGHFEYPATTRFGERIQVSISAAGYRELKYPMIDGSLKDVTDEQLELGKFQLFKLPTTTKTTVTVIAEGSGRPVQDAKLVFIGIDSGKRVAVSDDQGVASLELVNTGQLVAVKADGFELSFSFVKNIPDEFKVSLVPINSVSKNVSWLESDWSSAHSTAQELIAKLQVPAPKQSTYYRQSLFFESQLTADFASFEKNMLSGDYEIMQDNFSVNSANIFLNAPSTAVKFLQTASLPIEQKATYYSEFALLTEDEDLKEELYGEAFILTGECSGKNKLLAAGPLATNLVLDGHLEVAKELISDVWDEQEELLQQLKSGEVKSRIASGVFVPLVGLVDADAAIQLVKLTAREMETPELIAQALAYASMADDQDLDAICKKNNVKFDASGLNEQLLSTDLSHAKYESMAKWIRTHISSMPDSNGKVASIMFAARQMEPGSERKKLLTMAASAREACNVAYSWHDPAKEILEELPKFKSLTANEYDELLFASLEHAPPTFNSYQLNGVFANLVKMIAVRDPIVARKMLDPAFENGAWLYDNSTWSAFRFNSLLKAYAWIDPKLAGKKVIELSEKYSHDNPVRRLELLTSAINELNSIAIRKGMLRHR